MKNIYTYVFAAKSFLILVFTLLPWTASPQYYDWGQNPSSIKWEQVETDNGKLVFPEYYRAKSLRLMHYMDSIRPYIGYGFTYGPMKLPVLTHTQNFSPNGLVLLAPKRMELIVTPPAETFAMPWLKQLAAHEYRHAVHYNNVNRGVFKVLSYVLGQQGSLAGVAFIPYWMMEGDAVLAETQMSTFGRGLQPSFTIDYRAMFLEGNAGKYAIDKFFCGSFKDHLPDHYSLGYQITSYAYTKFGENIWDKVAQYGTRKPYLIFTAKLAQKKFYGTSTNKLFNETFANLSDHWKSIPYQENSSQLIETPLRSFTTYSTPVQLDRHSILSLKTDLDKSTRIVRTNTESGHERTIYKTGAVNTGLSAHDGKLYWTEFRQSTFWEQRVNSVIQWFDPGTGKSGSFKTEGHSLFPTSSPHSMPAYINYDYSGSYSIVSGQWKYELPDTLSVHGLAYDDLTAKYYFIGLSDAGMWIGSVREGDDSFDIVTRPGYTTLSGLKASKGKLYFNSIYSGKDEVHVYELMEKKEYRITNSTYGSFDPSPAIDGGYVLTTYTPEGYRLALHDDARVEEVQFTRIPKNVVNPERIKWDVPNLDDMVVQDTTDRSVKRYRKTAHLFQLHSWAPVFFEPERVLEEDNINIHTGVTLLSQNLLNSTFATAGYKYSDLGHSFHAKAMFYGLAPKFEVEAEYGLWDQYVYRIKGVEAGLPVDLENHFKLSARVYLPVLLSSGYHVRRLTPSIDFDHENSKLFYYYSAENIHYRNGLQKFKLSLQYSDNVRMSHRDFLPRWGYAVRGTYTSNPFNKSMSSIMSAYGRIYLPGIGPHHSLMLRGAAQKQNVEVYLYRQKELFPRGADYNFTPEKYASFAVDYQLPLWYPDGGISSLLYFKRIRANLSYDYARYRTVSEKKWRGINSYGMDITFDIVPVRLPPNTSTAVTISIHKPSDKNSPVIGVSLVLPI